jgi:hypothetical protein
MEVTIRIPDELVTQARALGLSPDEYVEAILAGQVELSPRKTLRTSEEIRAWLDSLAQFSDKVPELPRTISRDWIYLDHY